VYFVPFVVVRERGGIGDPAYRRGSNFLYILGRLVIPD
jgi:hypothetical protein